MRLEWVWLRYQSGAMDAYEFINWFKYANWLSMSQLGKGIERMAIGHMIFQDTHWGYLVRYELMAWDIFICLLSILLRVVTRWVNVYILCIYIYICDDMNICYLLLVIFCALVLFLGWRLSIEHVVAQPLHLFFFPQVWLLLVACRFVLYYATHSKCVRVL